MKASACCVFRALPIKHQLPRAPLIHRICFHMLVSLSAVHLLFLTMAFPLSHLTPSSLKMIPTLGKNSAAFGVWKRPQEIYFVVLYFSENSFKAIKTSRSSRKSENARLCGKESFLSCPSRRSKWPTYTVAITRPRAQKGNKRLAREVELLPAHRTCLRSHSSALRYWGAPLNGEDEVRGDRSVLCHARLAFVGWSSEGSGEIVFESERPFLLCSEALPGLTQES